jgi:hypothetical protein
MWTPPNNPHGYLPPSSAHKPGPAHVLLHPMLTFARTPSIHFDVSSPPSAITAHHHALSSRVLAEPATSPPLSHLTLLSAHLPWSIPVRPGSSKPGAFVTVGDVFTVLYRALRVNITGHEYNSLPPGGDQHRAKGAYEKRCRRIRDPRGAAEERKGGMKRVDFLMGRLLFTGLSSSSKGIGVLYFHVT